MSNLEIENLSLLFNYVWSRNVLPTADILKRRCNDIVSMKKDDDLKTIHDEAMDGFISFVKVFKDHMQQKTQTSDDGNKKSTEPSLDHHKIAAAMTAALLLDCDLFVIPDEDNEKKIRVNCCFLTEIIAFRAGLDVMQFLFIHDSEKMKKRPFLAKAINNGKNYDYPDTFDGMEYDYHMCKTLRFMKSLAKNNNDSVDVFQLAQIFFLIEAYSEMKMSMS